MTLGDKLNELMSKRGWTYYKLAKISGVPKTTVENLINNRIKSTKHENLLRFAYAFEINVSELLEDEFTEVKEKQLGDDYIEVVKNAKNSGISPQQLHELIEVVTKIKDGK